jgi:hypothetical protein
MLPRDSRPAHPSAPLRSYLPLFVFLGYTAFLVTGFGIGLGSLQPIPVYVFLCLVLLVLQETLSADRSLAHVTYVFITSAFAVLYAGAVVFGVRQLDFTRTPMTYILLNAVLAGIFLVDLVSRRRPWASARREAMPLGTYATVASDFGAAAVFFFVSALLLDLLGSQLVLRRLGLPTGKPYVIVDLNTTLHLALHSPVNLLDGLDFVLGLAALAGAGVFLVIAGTLLPASEESGEGIPFSRLARDAAEQAIFGLRMVLIPLVWLIPAFGVALFSRQMARYYALAAKAPGSFLDLINPFSATSRASLDLGMSALLLAILSCCGMLFAVFVTEQNPHVFRRTAEALLTLGRGIALSLAFFMYTLAVVNIVVVLLGITQVKPFQVSLPGLLALIVGIGWVVGESRRDTLRTRMGIPVRTQGSAQGQGPITVPIMTPGADQR